MKKFISKINCKILMRKEMLKQKIEKNIEVLTIKNLPGELFIDKAIWIIVIIVIGLLLLAAFYAIFKDTLIPKMQESIMAMFDFAG